MASTIGIVLGSFSDVARIEPGIKRLQAMRVPFEICVASAHRTPERLAQWLAGAESRGVRVIVAAAGAAAHLPGVVASKTLLPVVGLPLNASPIGGTDALYSIVQMPPGIPVATVGIDSAENAVILAMHILAVSDAGVREKLRALRADWVAKIEEQNTRLYAQYPEARPADAAPAADPLAPKSGPAVADRAASPTTGGPAFDAAAYAKMAAAAPLRASRAADHAASADDATNLLPRTPTIAPAATAEAPVAEKPDQPSQAPVAAPPAIPAQPQPYAPPAPAHQVLRVHAELPDVSATERAVEVLRAGGVVALPTDTVYGLAADATNAAGVARLYAIKGRAADKAIPVLVDSDSLFRMLVVDVPERVDALMAHCWPGALSLVCRKHPQALLAVSADETLALRMPDNLVALGLINMLDRPLATTSANLSGLPPATTADEVVAQFGDAVDLVLDAGPTAGPGVSTVLSVVEKPYRILRQGTLLRDTLREILGDLLAD